MKDQDISQNDSEQELCRLELAWSASHLNPVSFSSWEDDRMCQLKWIRQWNSECVQRRKTSTKLGMIHVCMINTSCWGYTIRWSSCVAVGNKALNDTSRHKMKFSRHFIGCICVWNVANTIRRDLIPLLCVELCYATLPLGRKLENFDSKRWSHWLKTSPAKLFRYRFNLH